MADKSNDPVAMWQNMIGEMEKGFNSFANQAMSSPEFSKVMNQVGGASEFGWHGVTLTDEAKTDAVLGAMPVAFPIFQWHDDTFTLPPSAVRLASSMVAENQAFRLGRAVYAFQFHFEADRAVVDYWTTAFADTVTARWPDWPERLPAEAARNAAMADQSGLAIARAWVATI